MTKEREFDLQDRFIDHLSTQILRSGTSPAPNYGEALSAESKADFVHKLKVPLKELWSSSFRFS